MKKSRASLLSNLSRPYPARDWFFILSVSFGTFIIFIFIGGYLFWSIDSGMVFRALKTNAPSAQSVTETDIKEILNFYTTRRAISGALPPPQVATTTLIGQ